MEFGEVYLTPELFFRLDALSRRKVGRVIQVLPPERMEGSLAKPSLWTAGICVNPEAKPHERRYREVGVIMLVNQINVKVFRNANRTELDWAEVPIPLIYDFLIWHEIGHLIMGHLGVTGVNADFAPWDSMNVQEHHMAHLEMERRADRFAWEVLFPECSIPIKNNPRFNLKELDKFAKKYEGFFEQTKGEYAPLPGGWSLGPQAGFVALYS